MITPRPFAGLGHADHGWLDARHHFSFADYHDADRMGVGPLRVWNDDTIAPDTGFPMHPHRNMEIITYVRQGAITHQDHLGNHGRTAAGDIQVMSAGKGILHAEFNREPETTTLFQIWIVPARTGGAPHWEQRAFPTADRAGLMVPLASGLDELQAKGAVPILQDATLFGAILTPGQRLDHRLVHGGLGYLVVARGGLEADGVVLGARDGAVLHDQAGIALTAGPEGAEFLLADLPTLTTFT